MLQSDFSLIKSKTGKHIFEKMTANIANPPAKTIEMEFVRRVRQMVTGPGEITYLPRPSRYDAR